MKVQQFFLYHFSTWFTTLSLFEARSKSQQTNNQTQDHQWSWMQTKLPCKWIKVGKKVKKVSINNMKRFIEEERFTIH